MKKYLSENSKLASEFHPTKNGDSKPEDFTAGSNKKIWWQCPKDDEHDWIASISHRGNGSACPFCSGNRVSKTNNLLVRHPKLAGEWHPTKNKDLKPEDFTAGSNKKVWWQCPKYEDHEWESNIGNRYRGSNCPFCDGKQASKSNNLLVIYPEIASEWHPTKNGDLKPEDFTTGSSTLKIWWQCSKDDEHEWEANISRRTKGSACPFCSGYSVSKTNNLLAINPLLASEWHPTKNGDLKPEDFTAGSDKKIWWQCSKIKEHQWENTITRRNIRGGACPFCSNRRVDKTNNLLAKNPEIASEWHPTKNRDLKPQDFTPGSNQKVWWQCGKREEHNWETTIHIRTRGHGCPFCTGIGTSEPEIRVLCELRYLFGSKETEWRRRIDGVEVDIFLSKFNIGIEYDGAYWHKEKLQSDKDKNIFFQKKGIQILRIREHPLKIISSSDIVVGKDLNKDDLNTLILKIKEVFKFLPNINLDAYMKDSSFLNQVEFKRFISYLPSPPPEYSILRTHPNISKQWDVKKNSPLLPENFTSGAKQKVWWQCSRDINHEWFAIIDNRCRGAGCPFCSGNRVSKTNSLLAKNPEVASEWHPTKNGDLTPQDFTAGSTKKVWWQCSKGDEHEWEARIYSRKKRKCPFCSGKKVSKTNNLLVKNPLLSMEWHPTKNGNLKPGNFTSNSGKKIWWQCPEGDEHEWESAISNRNRGSGCPFCSGARVSKTNNLLARNPKLASEWHPTKNGDLKPENVTSGAEQKVWWQCSKVKDHEWETKVYSRNQGRDCPFCSKMRKSK